MWTSVDIGSCTHLARVLVQLPMDFWFGEADYSRRQRGLCAFVRSLPVSVIDVTVQMSYYSWEKHGHLPFTDFSLGIQWTNLDIALEHIALLEALTIQWYLGQDVARDLQESVGGGFKEWEDEIRSVLVIKLPRVAARAVIEFNVSFAPLDLQLC